MIFANPWILLGLAGVLGPVILHLLKRRAAKPVSWGAMRFLIDTVSVRRRRIEWEEMVLMAARCLLVALIALALARPLVPPDSLVPWRVLLPVVLLGVAAFGASFVMRGGKGMWLARALGLGLLLGAAGLVIFEEQLNLRRFQRGSGRDVALVIDGSTSMNLDDGTGTAFGRAINEAKGLVSRAPRGTAFAVIVGGAAPELITASPLSHREDVLEVLDGLKASGGTFRVRDALGLATLALAEGSQGGKEIVVFTDPQRRGWATDEAAGWDELAANWKALATKPRVMVRMFVAPLAWRNVAVGEVRLSREVVGIDREVTVEARVINTGSEAVTPRGVAMKVDGAEGMAAGVGLLAPGESRVVTFRHKFSKTGPALIEVQVDVDDDLTSDNRSWHAVAVDAPVRVWVVEGHSGGSFMERAGSMVAMALAPQANAGEAAMNVEVVSPAELAGKKGLETVDVMVLADVARLPEETARRVAEFVSTGGGLWVMAGPQAEAIFYNTWKTSDGLLMPVDLGGLQAQDERAALALETLDHPALAIFKDGGDLDEGIVSVHRTMKERGPWVAGRLGSGDALFAARDFGRGRVMVSAGGMDAQSGTLAGRRSFVPLAHQWAIWLAAADKLDPNLPPSWRPMLRLNGGGGLRGSYFSKRGGKGTLVVQRLDPCVDFNWGSGSPVAGVRPDDFSVRWEGQLTPPESGMYRMELSADDQLEVVLDGRKFTSGGEGKIQLTAGKPVPVTANYDEAGGLANVVWRWVLPSGGNFQVVPSAVLGPPPAANAPVDAGRVTSAKDGDEREYPVRAVVGRKGQFLEIEAPARPGVFRLKMTEELRKSLPWVTGDELPVVVKADLGESEFAAWTDQDREFLRKRMDFLEPGTVEEMVGVLEGRSFGRELWRLLMVATFGLLLVETALGRWIAGSRRIAENHTLSFGDQAVRATGTVDMLKETRKEPR